MAGASFNQTNTLERNPNYNLLHFLSEVSPSSQQTVVSRKAMQTTYVYQV